MGNDDRNTKGETAVADEQHSLRWDYPFFSMPDAQLNFSSMRFDH